MKRTVLVSMGVLVSTGLSLGRLALAQETQETQETEEEFYEGDYPVALFRPPLPDLADQVRDEEALLVLGKALFWDQQVSSDGQVACATCHFAGGSDHRRIDTVHPGENGILEVVKPGEALRPEHFPIQSDDIIGSQGIVEREFRSVDAQTGVERGAVFEAVSDRRRVTNRNSPTNLNAVLSAALFWDGRVGAHVTTATDAAAAVPLWAESEDGLRLERLGLADLSLAAQGVAPVLNAVEMSYAGRGLSDLGEKLLALQPLGGQVVHPADGVLGVHRAKSGQGLEGTYRDLVQRAFVERLWDSDTLFGPDGKVVGSGLALDGKEHSLAAFNFGFFMGLAIHAYESTLVSDDTKFDRVRRGEAEFTPEEARGYDLFLGKACCFPCHAPPEFTAASLRDPNHEHAFVNTGLRPIEEDAGRGEGRFKTPSLRNVALTGPYFHNGSRSTLLQVLDFYDRGGDYATEETDFLIQPIGLSEGEKVAVVHFLTTLTDERVRRRAAPFDGPSLNPPNGPALPATGAEGGEPIQPFLGLSPFDR